MGNSLTCLSIPSTLHDSDQIPDLHSGIVKILHLPDGLIMDMAATHVAELMLEFPGHFISHLDVDLKSILANQSLFCSDMAESPGTGEDSVVAGLNRKRLVAMAADSEVLGSCIYIVVPMERLNQRMGDQEMGAIYKLLCFHFLSTEMEATAMTMSPDSSPTASSNCVPFRIPNLCGNSKVAPASTCTEEEETHCDDDSLDLQKKQKMQDGDGLSLTFCFKSFPGCHNTINNIRYKSWTPKLDTICE